MPFAIMRCSKIKSAACLASSLQHNFRERDTPNADTEKTPQNVHLAASRTSQAMGLWRKNMPATFRKDAVIAIEYMMTASPEWFKEASEASKSAFYEACVGWVQSKYGEENIIACSVHLDEKTPHVAMFVTPITQDGRLSAKEFIGNRAKMSADQDSFHAAVAHLGLERGIKGSRAKHKSIKRFYAEIEQAQTQQSISASDVEPKVVKKGFISTTYETAQAVAERLNEQLKPLQQQASNANDVRRRLSSEQQAHKRTREERDFLRNDRDKQRAQNNITSNIIDIIQEVIPLEQRELIAEKLKQRLQQEKGKNDKER